MLLKPVTHYLILFLILFTSHLSAQNIIARVDTSFANIKYVDVRANFCQVDIGAISENGRVEFFGEISSEKKQYSKRSPYKFRYFVSGNRLKVWIEGHKRSGLREKRLMFKVPPQTNVTVRNKAGSIYAFGLRGNYTKLETRTGSIKAQYINSRIAEFKSFTGYIKVENLNSSEVKFYSHSGSLKLTDAKVKKVTANGHSGSQRWINVVGNIEAANHMSTIRVIGGKGNTKLKSHSGTIRIYDYVGNVYARNYSGAIRLKNAHGAFDLNSNSGSIIGEGVLFTNKSQLHSSHSSIKMKLKNELNKINYNLQSNHGSIRIGQDRFAKKCVLNRGGNIFVKATSGHGSLFFDKYEEEK